MLELAMLCGSGAGLEAVAPAVCRSVRDLLGAEAVALFWLDDAGMPLGFHHEDSPDSARDLFLNEFDRLFTGPQELNVFTLANQRGAAVGRLISPEASYYRSNTFNLLVRPSGHHHAIDLRLESDGVTRAVLLAFRDHRRAFSDSDAAMLPPIRAQLQRALAAADPRTWRHDSGDGDSAVMLVDADCRTVLHASADLLPLLRRCTLVGQNVRINGSWPPPPHFVRDVCAALAGNARASRALAIPAGRLIVSAAAMATRPDAAVPPPILVTLTIEAPGVLTLIPSILDLGLSPLRSELALFAASGGARIDASRHFGISKEALKKHLAEIYARAGATGWGDLAGLFGQAATGRDARPD